MSTLAAMAQPLASSAEPLAANVVQSVDWLAIAPPTLAAVVGLVVLVADLFVTDARKAVLGWLSVAGLAASALLLLPLRDGDRATFCLTGDADTCSYVADRFTLVTLDRRSAPTRLGDFARLDRRTVPLTSGVDLVATRYRRSGA